jgi:hypothetical protein
MATRNDRFEGNFRAEISRWFSVEGRERAVFPLITCPIIYFVMLIHIIAREGRQNGKTICSGWGGLWTQAWPRASSWTWPKFAKSGKFFTLSNPHVIRTVLTRRLQCAGSRVTPPVIVRPPSCPEPWERIIQAVAMHDITPLEYNTRLY